MEQLRADLRTKTEVDAGSLVLTTIRKFFPEDKGDRYPLLPRRRLEPHHSLPSVPRPVVGTERHDPKREK